MAEGTIWGLPNYSGDLFTADPVQTPLLTMIGGLTGGMSSTSSEFETGQLYSHPDAEQPDISENDSTTAPAPSHIPRDQQTNVCQIHQETISLTYHKLANSGTMSGINKAGQTPNPTSDKDWQLAQKLVKVARDVEHSFISGTYQRATNAGVANRTRGLLEVTKLTGGTNVDADGEKLSKAMVDALFCGMADGGAMFRIAVMFLCAEKKQQVSEIYNLVPGFALPPSRNYGGLDIQAIDFDFGRLGIVWNRFMPKDALLVADIAYLAPVFTEVPEKGVFFVEPLAKKGASEDEQLYGEIGLDHGPAFMHGSITNLG